MCYYLHIQKRKHANNGGNMIGERGWREMQKKRSQVDRQILLGKLKNVFWCVVAVIVWPVIINEIAYQIFKGD